MLRCPPTLPATGGGLAKSLPRSCSERGRFCQAVDVRSPEGRSTSMAESPPDAPRARRDCGASSQRLGAGGASTATRTGAKLPNLHKLSGELLPRLRQTARYMPFSSFLLSFLFLLFFLNMHPRITSISTFDCCRYIIFVIKFYVSKIFLIVPNEEYAS